MIYIIQHIGGMPVLYFFIVLTLASLIYALVSKKFIYLTIPVATMIIYIAVKIVLVPLPLGETLQFIFGLR
jgi:hypothetical protein